MIEPDDQLEHGPVVTLEGDLVEHQEEVEGNDDDEHHCGLAPNTPGQVTPERKLWNTRRLSQQVDQGKLAEEWARRLEHHSLLLVERLFEYLSHIKPETSAPQGLTLPASAIGWMATQLYPIPLEGAHGNHKEPLWMGASMRDRLSLLKYLLPRATHLRITADKWPPPVKRKKSNEGHDTPASFEGNDISLSAISVHSALTMETSLPAPPSLQAFLLYYHGIQNKPRVDLRVFPSLSVLFLDSVAPEWVANLPSGLQLLRVDRSGIFDVSQFMFPESDNSMTGAQLECLTQLKLSHCAIGELSGLRGTTPSLHKNSDLLMTPENAYAPPPLSRLCNLVSVCLSNNELRTVRSALAGLSSLPLLTSVNLSFNFLTSMNGCNAMLGNIRELVLSGNRLRKVTGLDKCYSVEILCLDRNEFQDVAYVATLANLPQLSNLYLHGNPFIENDPKRYRVQIFNLFKESRLGSLLPRATYRQLLEVLPVLDGVPANKRELVELRGLTFSQSVIPPGISHTPSNDMVSLKHDKQLVDVYVPVETESSPSLSVPIARRVHRSGKRRRAKVDKVLLHPAFIEQSKEAFVLPTLQFSIHDVITSLSASSPDEANGDLDSTAISADDGLVNAFKTILAEESMDLACNNSIDQSENALDIHEQGDTTYEYPVSPTKTNDTSWISHTRKMSYTSVSTIQVEDESTRGLDNGTDHVPSIDNSPTVLSLAAECDDFDQVISSNHISTRGQDLKEVPSERREILDILPKSSVNFPEHVWGGSNDALSISSSLGTSTYCAPVENKYHLAEENSFYDGPALYKHLCVMSNLELYFKSFVFSPEDHDVNQSFAGQLSDEELSNMVLKTAPRIQLRPLDRTTRESLNREQSVGIKPATLNETYLRVWREDVLACGKSTARRVAPFRTARRSFHGDILFSNGKMARYCETRRLILCSTNAAIYLIPDYEQLVNRNQRKTDKRRFPSPIPREALFQNAPWPHALARHPIHTLQQITIGFGFQRLTLRFCPGSADEQTVMGDEYTYVITTCNKLRTVALLQQLQEQTKEAWNKASNLVMKMTIDNDDKQVLEALSAAVAPNTVGNIMHYQILKQRWKHGDRGIVRRVCLVTDQQVFLLDEDYVGDGSESFEAGARKFGDVLFRLVDSADLVQVSQVQAAGFDPKAITIVIRPKSRLQRTRNWRLLCRDADGAERLVEDVRKSLAFG